MSRVQVAGTGSFLPGEPLTNDDLERLVGPLPADVLEGIQVERRHWMVDPATGEHRINNSEMATKAALAALDAAGVSPDAVELIVLSTASPDYLLPPLATFVQEALGLERCATMEIRSGCAGFVEALDVAHMYLERDAYETAVVIVGYFAVLLMIPAFGSPAT